jgi:hypothetical protein
VQHS